MARTKRNSVTKPKRPLKKSYVQYKQNGPDPGDYCPDCRHPTGFQNGFLICETCGWIDYGEQAIEIQIQPARKAVKS